MRGKDRLVIGLVTVLIIGTLLGGYAPNAWPATKSRYPERNITINVPYPPGYGGDMTARALARTLKAEGLLPPNVEIIITNENVGASSAIGVTKYATTTKSDDPYKLLAVPRTMLLNSIRGMTKHGWRDLKPLAQLVATYNGVAVSTKSKYKSLKDLIEALKKDPTSVTWIGNGPPSSDWNAWARLMIGADVSIGKVYYAASTQIGEMLSAILGGHAGAWTAAPEDVKGQIEAGNIRLLGVSSAQRLPGYPDVPTFSEVMGKECVFSNWRSLFGPKQMPDYAVEWWEGALKKLDKTELWKVEVEKLAAVRALLTTDDLVKMLEKDEISVTDLLKKVGLIK